MNYPRIRGRQAMSWLTKLRLDPLPTFASVRATFGTHVLFAASRGNQFLITFDPDDMELIFVTEGASIHKGRGLERASRLFGRGLLVSEDDLHRRQRRLSQPAFQPRRLAPYAEPMVRHALALAERLAASDVVDIAHEVRPTTLDIAAETMFGTTLDAEETHRLADALEVVRARFQDWMHPLAPLKDHLPLPGTLRMRRAIATIHGTVARIVHERRADPAAGDRTDLLSLLVRARDVDSEGDGEGMSEELMRDECVTLLLAGHETTANALAWAVWLLATHPDALAEVRSELHARVGDGLPTIDDAGELPYLRRVIAETLRLYPPAPALSRKVVAPITLASGIELPVGTELVLPMYAIHRDPEWFPDPERFDPDRFIDGAPPKSWPRHVWMPFGGGRRVCIGQSFAMLEMELVLAVLAQRLDFEVEPDQTIVPEAAFTLSPANGIRVRCTARSEGAALVS